MYLIRILNYNKTKAYLDGIIANLYSSYPNIIYYTIFSNKNDYLILIYTDKKKKKSDKMYHSSFLNSLRLSFPMTVVEVLKFKEKDFIEICFSG